MMAGCSSGGGSIVSGDNVWKDGTKPSPKAGTLGSRATPCTMPVSFDLAEAWKAKPVTDAGNPGGGFRQGSVTLICEIDAKPSGLVGYLRVWSGPKAEGSARQVLDAFLAGDKNISDRRDRQTAVGTLTAAETTYLGVGIEPDQPRRERALAVTTPQGAVVLHLGGLDSAEHEKLLPAYELAKNSMRVTVPPA
ncbi:lipoprotein [Streptomyces niveiscabiei]|uniref:Lipoprotein n=1 Tax=Streptomyces niveiscabiei TaxID=164115 RepID=A0ABW9I1X4_9ACTN